MNNELLVEVDRVYGKKTVYPLCDKAKLFASLSGTKTLTPHAIDCIKALGYTLKIQHENFYD